MRKVKYQVALSVALALGLVPLGASVHVQGRQAQGALKLSKEEQAALIPIETAIKAKDFATAAAAVETARPAIRSADANFAFSNFQFEIGRQTKNWTLFATGLEGLIASGRLPAAELPKLYQALAGAQEQIGQSDKAAATWEKYLQLNPNDTEAMVSVAQSHFKQKRASQGLAMLERAITAQRAAGQTPPENWYRVAFGQAVGAGLKPQAAKFSRELVAAYPNPTNWREALLIYKQSLPEDRDMSLDVYRLMRVNKAIASERDYDEFLRALSNAGYPGEALAVLNEGVAAGTISAGKAPFSQMRGTLSPRAAAGKGGLAAEEGKARAASTGAAALLVANSYFGFGDYAKAAELYRTALQKGSVDANVVNTRLGLALGLAGQKAEAEAALKSITGPRSELASFLLVWLGQRA